MAQLVAEELVDTGFTSHYETVDWTVPLVLGSMTAAHPWMPSVRWQRQVVPLFSLIPRTLHCTFARAIQ